MKQGMNRNLILMIAGAVILVLVVFVVVLLNRDSDDYDEGDTIYERESDLNQDPDNPDAAGISGNDPVERLERYQEWAKYPPNSRPLHKGQHDLVHPYDGKKSKVGIVTKPGKNCKMVVGEVECEVKPEISKDVHCNLNPASSILVGKGEMHFALFCHNEKGQNLEITNIKSQVYRMLNRKRQNSQQPTHTADDGTHGDAKSGDKIYAIVVRPTTRDWGHVYLEVDMEVNGLKHNQRADFQFTPHIVAEFGHGTVTDSIDSNGSLVIRVPIIIKKKGDYDFQANLQEEGGDKRFIAHSSVRKEFTAGPHNLEFVFFGKIIRDANIDGPYVMREIRGMRNNGPVSRREVEESRVAGTELVREKNEPQWEHVKPYGKTYTTQTYRADQFSQDEYDSEEKQRRIQLYESQISEE